MPPEPLPCDRKDFFRDRKHDRSSDPLGPVARWRDSSLSASSSSSSYGGGSRGNDFSPRWGFPSDFRRPTGHGKQGGWHMYPEDSPHGYPTSRYSDRFVDDEGFRPSGPRGDGRYGRVYRENRTSFGQREWRSHSWEANHHQNGPRNTPGRPHCMNDQKSPHCVNDQKSPHYVNERVNDQKSPLCVNERVNERVNDQKSPHCVNERVNDQKSPHCVNERVNDQKPPYCVNNQKPPYCVNDQKPSQFVNNQKPPHCVNDQKSLHCVNDQKSPHSVNNQKSPHCTNNQKSPHCTNNQKSPHCTNNQKSPHCTNDQKSTHCMNVQKSPAESPKCSSHPHSEPSDQFQSKDQVSKTSDVSGPGTGPKIDKENALGLLDWKPVKWSRSGSLTSRCSGFSHSSSTKSIAEECNDVKGNLPTKKGSPLQSPTRDVVTCPPSIILSEDAISRKKPRLGWGMGLAKYERQKGDGPEENNSKSGNVTPSNVERTHSFTSNLVEKSPRIAGVSDCSSPATPSSVTCSSSQGLEDKAFGRTSDADVDPNSFSVSPMAPVPENQHEGLHFILEKLELNSITDLSSLISELLQADEQCSLDYGFKRSSTVNKLLLWKDDISKSLEMTETEIDSLENELKLLKSLKSDCVSNSPCLVSLDSLSVDCKDEPQEHLNVIQRPPPLEVVSSKDIVARETRLCVDATACHSENKDQDVDSPGTATSKLMEPISSRKRPAPDGWHLSSEKMNLIDAEKTLETSCQGDERTVFHDDCVPRRMWNLSLCDQKVDSSYDSIFTSNKDSATRASEVLDRLLPDGNYCFGSMEANERPTLPAELTITEKFLQRKRFEKFKEGALSLKYRVFHHLWKEDLRLLSLKNNRSKPQKKFDLSTRTTLNGIQKHRSSNRSRFSTGGSSSLVPMTEIVKFTSKMLSDSQPKIYRDSLKMPSMILDPKEKSVRFVSNNGLVEDPWACEKERALINPWTNEEKEIFMDKLANIGKDFGKIASFLDHKTTADCVEFYYKNHKSDCFEKTKKKQGKPLSTSTYLVTSGKKWSREREMNAASLDILGAASVIAAQAEAVEPSKSISGKSRNRKPKAADGTFEASSSYCFAEDERETEAADVLAGICGSLSSEAMSSCITSSVDPTEGNQDLKHQKVGSFGRRPLTPEVTQKIDNHDDDDTYSDESCAEMDPVDWTDSEKSLFVQAFSSYGKDFTMISQAIQTKSRDLCRVFFSKARKCLGLDSIPNVTIIHGSTVETDSTVCTDKSGSRMDEDLPHINQDVSIPEAIVTDTSTSEDNCSAEESDHRDNGHQEDIFSGDCVQVDMITQDDTSMAEASIGNTNERSVSKLESELINVSSSSVDLVGSRERDYSNPLETSGSTVNQSEPSQVARVFPFDLSLKQDVDGISPHKEDSKAKAQSFGDSFLMKCNHEQKNEGHMRSIETEKPVCRNGNVKLFGKILSTPSSTEIPTCSVQMNDKMVHDHNGLMGLENVPIRSYGFWDGTKIQTGFSSMPDSALLLAKYPAAFGNYTISSLSSSKAEQPPPLTLIPEGDLPFTFDVKQNQDTFPEANREKFERLPEGGDVVVGGISDPVAALKLHYARNGLIREESSWRSKGDVGR